MENIISLMEVQEGKVVRNHASQASGSHDVPNEESLSIVIDKSFPSKNILQKLKSLDEVPVEMADWYHRPRIQKVPFRLRENMDFNKYFEPQLVTIGPLHHSNQKFELSEEIKLKLARLFTKEHALDKEKTYINIKSEIKNLRKCYDEEEIKCYNDEDLAWMFLVDGCAVLHFIDCVAVAQYNGEKLKKLNMKNDHIAFAQQDLFLLENQLPYQVLKLLMSSNVDKSEQLRTSINRFIDNHIMSRQQKRVQRPLQQTFEEEPTHLLDLLRARLLYKPTDPPSIIKMLFSRNHITTATHNWHSFRNVKMLKAAGIQLRPSKTSVLNDVFFHRRYLIATLELPPLIVDDSTAPKFLNLIAYEMCPDFVNDFGVISYVRFLDSLIDQAEDVIELRKAHILHNGLGSDEEVATLFNQISKHLVPNLDTYDDVKGSIQSYFALRWWVTIVSSVVDVMQKNPWTVVPVVYAVLAIAVSMVQTYYTIFPLHQNSTK